MLHVHPQFAARTPSTCYTYTLNLLLVHPIFATRTPIFLTCPGTLYRMRLNCGGITNLHDDLGKIFNCTSSSHIILIMSLTPPPTTETYVSLDLLVSALNAHAGAQGYAVVKQRTKTRPKTGMVVKAYFRCDRGGKPEKLGYERKRKHSTTRLIDCLFSCFASYKQDTGV